MILVSPFCLADSLIFYESFDDQSSLNANGCISCSVTSFGGGIKGNSVYFGAGSSLTYSVLGNIDKNQGTVSFWVKPSSLGAQGGLFDYGGVGAASSFGVFKTSSNEVHFETRTDENTQRNQYKADAFKTNNWTNAVIVWRTNNISSLTGLYVDGSLVSLWTYSSFNFNPAENYFSVGQTGFYGAGNAYLDELKVYDYVRPTLDIYKDYNRMINYTPPIVEPIKPQSNGTVKVNLSGLFVNNKPFYMKGVAYQPTPIGQDYGYDFFSHPEIYNRDFALLRNMHANTIRPWATVTNGGFLDAAYNNGVDPIYVIMAFYIGTTGIDYSDPATRETLKQDFRDYVLKFKDYPGVLMWSIGNENNYHYSGDISYWYSLVNEMAQDAYAIEGSVYHPVTCVNWEADSLGDTSKNSDDASMSYLDAWGINVYRGKTFGTFFDEYGIVSSRPLWISEYGVDAWHTTNLNNPSEGYEDEDSQAEWNVEMWRKIVSEDTIGGTVMEYSDEWNKDWNTNDPWNHNYGGYQAVGAHPDDYSNEEWYGIMRTVDNGASPDIMQPRKVYYALKNAFSEHEEFDIWLRDGWNLISFPLNLTNKSIGHVFGGISFNSIFSYGSWNYYFGEGNNNFNVIDETKGYWVNSIGSQTLTIEGEEFDNVLLDLDTEWSLAGHTSLSESEISALPDNVKVYMYNGSWYSYVSGRNSNGFSKFVPGYGYWIKKI